MRFRLLIPYLLVFSYIGSNAQIAVEDDKNLTTLVKNLAGPGLVFSNITTDCEEGIFKPYGQYTDVSNATGLSTGLLLTTGAARHAIGPNNRAGKGEQNSFDESYDQDLRNLLDPDVSDGLFYDICKVEFDVSVYSDTLRFNYIFASEEYLEFVGDFHDVFGFFISGPGITDTTNIALVPGTNDPVSVSTINNLTNSSYYVPNGNGTIPPFSNTMQYDGYTELLEAKVKVQPCETYHIKLIIADEGDGIYDSGIFLEAGSFRGSEEKLTSFLEYEDLGTAIEGCNDGYFTFHRVGIENNDLSQPVGIKYLIGGTAANGVDYDFIDDSITIPAFADSINLTITPLMDGIPDDNERVVLYITNDCPALPASFTDSIFIREHFYFPTFSDSVCEGESLVLNSPIQTLGYQLTWDANSSLSCLECSSPVANPSSPTSYGFTVKEPISGCTANSTYDVDINVLPEVFFVYSNDQNYTNLDFFFDNQSTNANVFEWDFGDGANSSETDPFHTFPVLNAGEEATFVVHLTGTNSNSGCVNQHEETIRIANPFFLPNIITPNRDFDNDEFTITGIHPNVWHLRVFNRWGKMVFKDESYNNRWTGDHYPDGTYFFELKNPLQDKFFKGYLQISR